MEKLNRIHTDYMYLYLPHGQEIPHICIHCGEEENLSRIKDRLKDDAFDSWGRRERMSSDTVIRIVKKLVLLIFIFFYLFLFLTAEKIIISLESVLDIAYGSFLLALIIVPVLFMTSKRLSIKYSLCKKHLRIRRLMFFLNWLPYFLGILGFYICFVYFPEESKFYWVSGSLILLSFLLDNLIFLLKPLSIKSHNYYCLVIDGFSIKFLMKIKQQESNLIKRRTRIKLTKS